MTHPNVPAAPDIQLTKRADELKPGDRIAAAFLHHGEPGEILFVLPYEDGGRVRWSLVVHRTSDDMPDVDFFIADAQIPVEPAADTGMDFSREPESTEAGTVAPGIEGGPVVGRAAKNGGE